MIKYIIPLILLLSISSCSSKKCSSELDCEKFSVGKFVVFKGEPNQIEIERSEFFQFDISENGDSKYKIIWTDACKCVYEMKLIETSNVNSKYFLNKIVFGEIIETGDNYYVLEMKLKKDGKTGTKVKVELDK